MGRWDERFKARYGPWAVIAGASEGLGAEWATQMAASGLNIVLISRRKERLDELAARLASQHGVAVRTLALDLGSEEVGDEVASATGDLDVGLLVYDAARSIIGPFLVQPLADHLNEIQVNVRAPLILAYTLGQRMVARGRGGIVLLSSLSATMGSAYIANYAATKAYNLVLAEGLWEELRAGGVDVLACCAGATRTPGYVASAPRGRQATMTPRAVVAETLRQLGKRPSFVPGAGNRLAALFLRRVLPRRTAITIMAGVTRGMYAR
jgi:short-subunit dehydrogenase